MESVSVGQVTVALVVTNACQDTLVIQIAFLVIALQLEVFLLFVTILVVVLACRTLVVSNAHHVKPVITNILNVSLVIAIPTDQLVFRATMRVSVSVPITLTANNVTCVRRASTIILHVKNVIVILLA